MAGKTKPHRLVRVGHTLYKRLAEAVEGNDGTQPAEEAGTSTATGPTAASSASAGAAAPGPSGRETGSHVVLQVLQDPLGVSGAAEPPTPGAPEPAPRMPPSLPSVEVAGGIAITPRQSATLSVEGGMSSAAAAAASGPGYGAAVPGVASEAGLPGGGMRGPLPRPPSPALQHPLGPQAPLACDENGGGFWSALSGGLPEARSSRTLVADEAATSCSAAAPTGLLRPRSASKVMPSAQGGGGPRANSSVAGPSSGGGGGGLLGGFVKDLGLSAGPEWKATTTAEEEAEEAAAAAARIAAAAAASIRDAAAGDGGEDLCIICYDQPPSCVLLECGHGGFCKRCAYLLFVRPPGECPTCRQAIEQVVELTEVTVPIGQVSSVK